MRSWTLALFRWLSLWVVGQGILLWLATKNIRPQEWVATMLGIAASPDVWAPVSLILSGALSFVAAAVWELVHADTRAKAKEHIRELRKLVSSYLPRIRIERPAAFSQRRGAEVPSLVRRAIPSPIPAAVPRPAPPTSQPTPPPAATPPPPPEPRKPRYLLDELDDMIRVLGEMEKVRTEVCEPGYGAANEARNMWGRFVINRGGGDLSPLIQQFKDASAGVVGGWDQLTKLVAAKHARYSDQLRPTIADDQGANAAVRGVLEDIVIDLTEMQKAKETGINYERFLYHHYAKLHEPLNKYGQWFGLTHKRIKDKTDELRGWHNE